MKALFFYGETGLNIIQTLFIEGSDWPESSTVYNIC